MIYNYSGPRVTSGVEGLAVCGDDRIWGASWRLDVGGDCLGLTPDGSEVGCVHW